jgi:hypothetical protein
VVDPFYGTSGLRPGCSCCRYEYGIGAQEFVAECRQMGLNATRQTQNISGRVKAPSTHGPLGTLVNTSAHKEKQNNQSL